jgi:ubiquinone/menaquinone biosynthesis C-methylase UbiE
LGSNVTFDHVLRTGRYPRAMPLFRHRRNDGSPHPVDAPGAHAATAADRGADWRSYETVAATYSTVLERITEPPTADLIQLLEGREGDRVLDVGTGAGVATRYEVPAAGPTGLVVGVDPSMAMISEAVSKGGGGRFLACTSIDLPFRDERFDRVSGSFVLSHFPDYHTALFDMLRVLKRGGRMAVSAWAQGEDQDEFSAAWTEVQEEFAEHEMLVDAHHQAVPWEEYFSDSDRLKDALHEAGLRDIWIERREYRVEMTIEEYVAGREINSTGRFLRRMLGEEFWPSLQRRAREVFAERFPPRINDFHEALLAVGHKP